MEMDTVNPALTEQLKTQTKTRRPRFKPEELEVLLDAALQHRSVLVGKHSSTVTEERKKSLWIEIMDRVNAVSSVPRGLKELQDKLRHFASEAKNENARIKKAKAQSGGPPPDRTLSSSQLKALQYVGEVAVDGVPGGISAGIMTGQEAADDDSSVGIQDSEVNEAHGSEPNPPTKRRKVSGPVAELTGIQQGILDSLHNIEASLQQQAEQMERQANAMEVFVSCVKLHLGVETVVELEQ